MDKLKKENNNRKSEEIPDDWDVKRLKDIYSLFHNGIWGSKPKEGGKSYPVIRSTETRHDGKLDLSKVAYRRIPDEKLDKYVLKDGDILLVGSSGSSHLIGRATIFFQPEDQIKYLFSNFMIRLQPKNINQKFLYYYLNSKRYYRFLKSIQQTSTGLRNLPKEIYNKMRIPLPPLPEQKKIAEILGTVDKAIQKVDESIGKTKRLKKGFMQELLTKGIPSRRYTVYSRQREARRRYTVDGRQEEKSRQREEGRQNTVDSRLGKEKREFKETEIGRIPKEWKVTSVQEIIIRNESGTWGREIEEGQPSYPVLRSTNMTLDMKINYKNVAYRNVERDVAKKYELNYGDIIISKSSGSKRHIGKVAIFENPHKNKKYLFSNFTQRIRVNDKICRSKFLYYFLSSPNAQSYLEKIHGTSSGLRNINMKLYVLQKLPLPPLHEQQKITEILSSVDKKLEILRNRKEKYQKIKKGLMNDLLTGRRRIKV